MKLFETDMDGEFKRRENVVREDVINDSDPSDSDIDAGRFMPDRETSYNYDGLIWEKQVCQDNIMNRKRKMNYIDHLERITAIGYTRAPTPSEYFDLVNQYFNDKIKIGTSMGGIVAKMADGDPEFFSCAMTKKDDKIIFYDKVSNIDIDDEGYKLDSVEYHGERAFDVKNLEDGKYYDLKQVSENNDGILFYLYGAYYRHISSFIHKNKPTIYIPREGELVVAGRGKDGYGVHGYYIAASRGVKEI